MKILLKVNAHLNKESTAFLADVKKPRLNNIMSHLNSLHLHDIYLKRFGEVKNTIAILAPYKKTLDELELMKTERKKEKNLADQLGDLSLDSNN